MTTWALAALFYFDSVQVLGPKCRTADCLCAATARVYWPSGVFVACSTCTAGWRRIADALGLALHVEEWECQPVGLTDAEQRFRLLELT